MNADPLLLAAAEHGGSKIHYAAASGVFSLTWLLIALPLAGAAVLLLGGRRTDGFGHLLGTLTSAASFVIGLVLFAGLLDRPGDDRALSQQLYSWIPVNGFRVDVGLLVDQLSVVFVLLITGVGTLIHIYSIGYMAHDPARRKFFAYMNLFLASMLLLVLGDNFLSLYAGWELVGLSSFLLIKFWEYKPAAATAANKAFYMNRVGDVGLALAIMFMFATVGSTSYADVFGSAAAGVIGYGTITAIALLLLLAACGKSGQFPLQAWLPDAMEGPTPISALIHAATMVTAGVYLIVRAGPIFNETQAARTVVVIIGAVTILIGCVIGCAYDDIKKVLAYSTVSQIGYMFLAVGLGPAGYAIGIMHLLAHGFFKAGLFLGSGSVIHAMNDDQDLRHYGGLWRYMKITWVTFGVGYLAIIGFPGFSGFFTKDRIIETAFDKGGTSGYLLGSIALLGAGITAFYMSRLFLMTFHGRPRWTTEGEHARHPHESPGSMTGPMILLAVGSLLAGGLFVLGHSLQDWLEPVAGAGVEGVHTFSPLVLTLLTLVVTAGGFAGAYVRYQLRPVEATAPPDSEVTLATVAARHDLFANTFNETVAMRPGQYLTRFLVWLDLVGVDGLVRGSAAAIGGLSGRMRRLQTGFVRSYALSMLGGAVLVVGALLLVRAG
ncbi:NADH dehydrogenase subunit L [Frankia casuarinae]|uniref:NADH dehydrogenase subunit L n=1 Tax=Frankia casuarinae (strain DSM 45818 / CECT 9043 / HFP020203 / CcI3) TaxID=106370 RepID=Q2JFK9_FRACC|nr:MULTISPECIES: NADH-quinone oxidoreductase subunit L [Frankia]ABD09933.1 NADH dehydrogenase subunit L [Frankia casuarinae]ETA04358.1 NADH dehydrogenase subunit L [Frankia sp. CcI6]EYT91400.1 NADH dehydrogenase subunit L [Frankia casuarinae]KDA44944.1 NADH dehydrogenase subunit L [Frankia sp. BMG5.23]KEZ38142.1 NADH dehydrogenase subunit L [Frankia sp. CeD]